MTVDVPPRPLQRTRAASKAPCAAAPINAAVRGGSTPSSLQARSKSSTHFFEEVFPATRTSADATFVSEGASCTNPPHAATKAPSVFAPFSTNNWTAWNCPEPAAQQRAVGHLSSILISTSAPLSSKALTHFKALVSANAALVMGEMPCDATFDAKSRALAALRDASWPRRAAASTVARATVTPGCRAATIASTTRSGAP
mmetsp:Transcript_4660/g.13298  ORF Transcript_4660/g.13298 Transcript_4660/m.13298 type:complete len:200 (-) Transcript_4660:147-746(-)